MPNKNLIRILIQGSNIVENIHHIRRGVKYIIQKSNLHVLQIKLCVRLMKYIIQESYLHVLQIKLCVRLTNCLCTLSNAD